MDACVLSVLETGSLRFSCGVGPVAQLPGLDAAVFRSLGNDYVSVLKQNGEAAAQRSALLEIGGELTRRFDDLTGTVWLKTVTNAAGEITLEIRSELVEPSDDAMALLQAPWELLTRLDDARKPTTFLASDTRRLFVVSRRLGMPAEAELFTPSPAHRLGIAFMASSPLGQKELDYEQEELAILDAVGRDTIDLVVEESGDPGQLGKLLSAQTPAMPVVHISCHGHEGQDGVMPFLAMEDETGGLRKETASNFAERFTPDTRPGLLFLSACGTAAATDGSAQGLAASLSTELIGNGFHAVLGWGGSVSDTAATMFATHLYAQLNKSVAVPEAAAFARRKLINADQASVSGAAEPKDHATEAALSRGDATGATRDWHLARIWLGRTGGGAVVGSGAQTSRSLGEVFGGTRTLQTARGDAWPVASERDFVGRRRELQKGLRVVDGNETALSGKRGVLLHGMGRRGKSSLAARISDRRPGFDMAVVFGSYEPDAILAAIKKAVSNDASDEVCNDATAKLLAAEIADRPNILRQTIRRLLRGPCGERPLLLLIDDFERIIDTKAGPIDSGRAVYRVKSAHRDTIQAVLEAFEDAAGRSRVIVTSRYRFAVTVTTPTGQQRDLADLLEPLHLGPLQDAAQRKLSRRQYQAAVKEHAELEQRLALLVRAQKLSQGNPGLHDLLGGKVVMNHAVPEKTAAELLDSVETYFEGAGQDADLAADMAADDAAPEAARAAEAVRDFVQQLTLGTLLDLADDSSRQLLRRLSICTQAVPLPVIETLAADHWGGSPMRLIDLGLLDPQNRLVRGKSGAITVETDYAVNTLASGRLDPLSPAEMTSAAGTTLGPLFDAWGGAAAAKTRPPDHDIQLTELALQALGEGGEDIGDDTTPIDVLLTCALFAVRFIGEDRPKSAAGVGERAIHAIDAAGRTPPLSLIAATAKVAITGGDGTLADAVLTRGTAILEETDISKIDGDQDEVTSLLFQLGQRQMQTGDLQNAETTWHRYIEMVEHDERRSATGRSFIADILAERGDLENALRIRRELLQIYTRLQDEHHTAVTYGEISDTFLKLKDFDEALRIRVTEQLPILERLNNAGAIAVAKDMIAEILHARGEADEALRIRIDEVLPVLRELKHARVLSACLWNIASIHLSRAREDENQALVNALPYVMEAFQIVAKLGDAEGLMKVGPVAAQVLAVAGKRQHALATLDISRQAAVKLDNQLLIGHIEEVRALIEAMPDPE